ncbi:MAG: PP2C family protein-serine/threonine phosphatase [Blastocatellia bacterium]
MTDENRAAQLNEGRNLSSPRVGARTHVGKVRSENQDRMGRFASRFGDLYIVVDGMGGHKGGAAAAAMAIDGLEGNLEGIPDSVPPERAIQEAAQKTNAQIYLKANDGDPDTAAMGATLVLGLLRGRLLIVGHAGDSRAYLFRGGKLTRLTRDHSLVQRMIDHEILTEEQARDHPDASVITRAFGQKPEIELEVAAPLPLNEGDGILLCTDGLCGYLNDQAIETTIRGQEDAQRVADALVDLALSAGGEDNVTVQFLQFGPRRNDEAIAPVQSHRPTDLDSGRQNVRQSLGPRIILLLAGIVALLLVAFVILRVAQQRGFGGHNQNAPNNANANRNRRENHATSEADPKVPIVTQSQTPSVQSSDQTVSSPPSGGVPETPKPAESASPAPVAGGTKDESSGGVAPLAGAPKRVALLMPLSSVAALKEWRQEPNLELIPFSRDYKELTEVRCVYFRGKEEAVKRAAQALAEKHRCDVRELPKEFSRLDHDIFVRP